MRVVESDLHCQYCVVIVSGVLSKCNFRSSDFITIFCILVHLSREIKKMGKTTEKALPCFVCAHAKDRDVPI